MSRKLSPSMVQAIKADENSEIGDKTHLALSNLLRENDALFVKNEPTSISLQLRRNVDGKLIVGASASVRIRVYATSDEGSAPSLDEINPLPREYNFGSGDDKH